MPIYEYKCENCEKEFELFHTTAEVEVVECPVCRSQDAKKLFSTFSSSSNETANVANDNMSGCCGGSCGCG